MLRGHETRGNEAAENGKNTGSSLAESHRIILVKVFEFILPRGCRNTDANDAGEHETHSYKVQTAYFLAKLEVENNHIDKTGAG